MISLDLNPDEHMLMDTMFLLAVGVLSEDILLGKTPSPKLMRIMVQVMAIMKQLGPEGVDAFLLKMNGKESGAFSLDEEQLQKEIEMDRAILDVTGESRYENRDNEDLFDAN